MSFRRKSLPELVAVGSCLALAGVLKMTDRPTSPELRNTFWYSKDVSSRCWKLLNGVTISGVRPLIVAAYMNLTFEHQAAILSLFKLGLFGSANALFRSCIEAAARGM